MAKEGQWVVHKFGGTSVAGTERYKGVARVVEDLPGARKAIVVSAMSKVTDALIDAVEAAKRRDDSYTAQLQALKVKHLVTVCELLPHAAQEPLKTRIEGDFKDLEEILRGVYLTRTYSDRTQELVSGHGELWSAQILSAYLISQGKKATWLDARSVLVVTPEAQSVVIDWEASQAKVDAWLKGCSEPCVVVTGFIASTPDGIPTTLKRNGSDYSASIFGRLLSASAISIWTDVDGVLSADPRLVPEAVVLDELSYKEATELAYFGAKVVHPSTMAPAIERKIPIYIRNTFNPSHPGTLIHQTPKEDGLIVRGFSTVDRMALVNVEGTGMIGVPGVAQRLFGALKEVGVSVVMISQASSEQSICFAIPAAQAELAEKTVREAFFAELHHGQIQTVDVELDCSILAAVGDNMSRSTGVAAQFFSALGKAGVNIRAIAQGSSERNISAVVAGADAQRALRAVHAAFFLSHQTISIGIVGPGLIGRTFLAQLKQEARRLKEEFRLDLRVRGILDSKRMFLADQSIDLDGWKSQLEAAGKTADLAAFIAHVHADHLPHAVLIDCTSSEQVAGRYAEWLGQGLHIITPNKKANTGTLAYYREMRKAARGAHGHYLYETTVGAGLPIINTLRDLVQTGDRVIQVEGVLSGTLSYLFNTVGSGSFSKVVAEARAKGYTEPDPRDDLSGMDVARKLVILAREAGLEIELSDVAVESLVPAALRAAGVDEFMARLPEFDGEMSKRIAEAAARGEVLRYVGVISPERKASVKLGSYPSSHAFARISGGDNIVAFTTERYRQQPLIVQGPGAGPDVTAAGVFADLLRLSSYLGASL